MLSVGWNLLDNLVVIILLDNWSTIGTPARKKRDSHMTSRKSSPALFRLLPLFVFALAACAQLSPQPPGQMCTLIGCIETLTVEFQGALPSDFLVEATTPDGSSVQVHCIDGQAEESATFSGMCSENSVSFYDFAPDEVTITVTWDGGEFSQTVRPNYTISYPNGPDCPPGCKAGTVQLQMP